MAFFSLSTTSNLTSCFSCKEKITITSSNHHHIILPSPCFRPPVTRRRRRFAVTAAAAEPNKLGEDSSSTTTSTSTTVTKLPKKPVYSMKKGQIVRVDKEKYLNSINYLSVGHPPYYKGLDYIYEDRGEILDLRIFETGEYALVAWVGIPTAPAWLPTDMLIKSEKLNYERL